LKFILTGATGFIGKNLMEYLCRLGYEVRCLSKEEFVSKDFSKLYGWDNWKADAVIHGAWIRNSDIHSLEHLDFARDSCEFFNYCKDAGLRVINLGSHNEYGVKFLPASEDMICEPIDTYGIAKLMVTLYAQKLGFNTLRLFAVYGEGGRNFKSIAENSLRYSQPENAKDFIPVEMVCHAVERLAHAQHLYGQVINVASGQQESAREIALKMIENEEIEREKEILNRFYRYPQRQYEPSQWLGDTSKMIKLLNIRP
jgi:nucleoside-diphosphate-sugar epimerase